MKRFGFSLVEILVVISIIGTMALVSLPLLNGYQKSSRLKNEARALATDLRLTQQLAITEQKIYTLELDPNTNSYDIKNSTQTIKSVIIHQEVAISELSTLTDLTAQYNPTGAVAQTGLIYLTNTKNETSTVEIKSSGFVSITN